MIRRGKWLGMAALVAGVVMAAPVARAGGGLEAVVEALPADTMAFVAIPKFQETDQRLAGMLEKLGLTPMLPIQSLSAALEQYAGIGEGFDATGMVALVILESPDLMSLQQRMGLAISATDPEALVGSLMPPAPPGEEGAGEDGAAPPTPETPEGVKAVRLFGVPSFASVRGKVVYLAPTPDAAKALSSESTLASKVKLADLKRLGERDIVIWANGEKVVAMVRPMIEPFKMIMQAQAAQGSPTSFQAISTRNTIKQIDMLLDGAQQVQVGLSLGPAGVGLALGFQAKAESELARQINLGRNVTGSLLTGLPGGPFVATFAWAATPGQSEEMVKEFDAIVEAEEIVKATNPDALTTVKNALKALVTAHRGVSVVLATSEPGPDGALSVHSVVTVSDSGRWLEELARLTETAASQLLRSGSEQDSAEAEGENGTGEEIGEAAKLLANLKFVRDVETIEGVNVSHIVFDLEKIKEIDPDDLAIIRKIIGQDGLVVRVAAVDKEHVVVGVGGGTARMAEAIRTAKAKEAPLAKTGGIDRVAAKLPKARQSEMYIAVDQIVRLIRNIAKATEEGEGLPITMPEINAPIGMTSSGANGYGQMDLYVPMETIVAVKDAIMQAMTGVQPGEEAPELEEEL